MPEALLSPVDVDIVLQWSEMQKMMDDLSENEEDSSSSSADSYENMSASDIMSVASDLDVRAVGRGRSFADDSVLAAPLAGADSLLWRLQSSVSRRMGCRVSAAGCSAWSILTAARARR